MSFGNAIESLKMNLFVARTGWNSKNMWLGLEIPHVDGKMTLPYIYMYTADKHLVPWLASQTDMLANDWEIVKGEK